MSDFMRFFDSFPGLPFVEVPDFPSDFFNSERLSVLEGAKFVGLIDAKSSKKFINISANQNLLRILKSLNIELDEEVSG